MIDLVGPLERQRRSFRLRTLRRLHLPALPSTCRTSLQAPMILRKQSFESLLESFDADSPDDWALKGKSLGYVRCQHAHCCLSSLYTHRVPALQYGGLRRYSKLQSSMDQACGHCCCDEGSCAATKPPSQQAQQSFFNALHEEVQSVDRWADGIALWGTRMCAQWHAIAT